MRGWCNTPGDICSVQTIVSLVLSSGWALLYRVTQPFQNMYQSLPLEQYLDRLHPGMSFTLCLSNLILTMELDRNGCSEAYVNSRWISSKKRSRYHYVVLLPSSLRT